MDIANIRVLIVALLVIGLASAQVNFSTSWGKRSSSLLTAPASSAQGSYLALRQKFHSKKESGMESLPQHNALPETDSGASTIYDDTEDQRNIISLPSPCVSLLKVLMLVNQIVEVNSLKLLFKSIIMLCFFFVIGKVLKMVPRCQLLYSREFKGQEQMPFHFSCKSTA